MKKKKQKSSKSFFFSIVATIAILAGFYIYQISDFSRISYLASKTTSDIKELKKENSGLKLSISKNKNLIKIEEKVKDQGYDKTSKLNYVVVVDDKSLAANKR